MSIRLWPQNYDSRDFLTPSEKRLMRFAGNNFANGHFAVGIDPMGANNTGMRLGLYISPTEGLLTFAIAPVKYNKDYIDGYITAVKVVEDCIYDRLVDSRCLISRNNDSKVLRFPYKHIMLFVDDDLKGIQLNPSSVRMKSFAAFGMFRPFDSSGSERRVSDLRLFCDIRKKYDDRFTGITDLECKAIFERLAPEYSIVLPEKENIDIPETDTTSERDLTITGKELEYKTFLLDEYQVALVNDMGRGHRVILANPGAGKSVLLLSKAFKFSKMYKESKVLLTCYNSNLSDSYKFKYDCAGFVTHNLYILTIHKLASQIMKEYFQIDAIPDDSLVSECICQIKKSGIKLSFKAIFIDEVQIFEPMYLELCYLLLDKSKNDFIFLMTGDLNQKIKAASKRGDAPWKKIYNINLDFTGRVRYIEKNYRNSKQISIYIQNMLKLMNTRLSMMGVINTVEYEYNSFKIGETPTIALRVLTGVDRNNLKLELLTAIKEIVSHQGISYNDIAILFPYRKHESLHYYILSWIEASLSEEGIPYSLIIRDKEKVKYHNTNGIVLSTIESSLGLDFKAVIVTGLLPYDYIFVNTNEKVEKKKLNSWREIQGFSMDEKEKIQYQMRAIYTACSRAREILYVVSDLCSNSPMEELIKVKAI